MKIRGESRKGGASELCVVNDIDVFLALGLGILG